MKLPEKIHKITIEKELEPGVFPPNGFLPFYEAQLGNGDTFGLYWEFGREDQEPVVCETLHDEGIIIPRFSNLDKFLEWYELNNEEWGEEEVDDDLFVYSYIQKGNDFLKQNNLEKAIDQYQLSTQSFGEISENWFKLATQQKRLGLEEAFQKNILNAILSNWSIEGPSQNAIRIFKNLNPIGELTSHPLIKNREKLQFIFGGTKTNDDYPILKEIIQELDENGEIIKSLLLEHNYAAMMYWETSAFQERYFFNLDEWKKNFNQKVKEKLHRSI